MNRIIKKYNIQEVIEDKASNGLGYERSRGIDLQHHLFLMNMAVSISHPNTENMFRSLGYYPDRSEDSQPYDPSSEFSDLGKSNWIPLKTPEKISVLEDILEQITSSQDIKS